MFIIIHYTQYLFLHRLIHLLRLAYTHHHVVFIHIYSVKEVLYSPNSVIIKVCTCLYICLYNLYTTNTMHILNIILLLINPNYTYTHIYTYTLYMSDYTLYVYTYIHMYTTYILICALYICLY